MINQLISSFTYQLSNFVHGLSTNSIIAIIIILVAMRLLKYSIKDAIKSAISWFLLTFALSFLFNINLPSIFDILNYIISLVQVLI